MVLRTLPASVVVGIPTNTLRQEKSATPRKRITAGDKTLVLSYRHEYIFTGREDGLHSALHQEFLWGKRYDGEKSRMERYSINRGT